MNALLIIGLDSAYNKHTHKAIIELSNLEEEQKNQSLT
jgi:hypothetical protein